MDLFPYNRNQAPPYDMNALRALVAEVLVPFDETSLLTLEDSKYSPSPSLSGVDWSQSLNDIDTDKLHLRVHLQAVQPSMDVSLLLSLSLIDCGMTDTSLISLFGVEGKYFNSSRSASSSSVFFSFFSKNCSIFLIMFLLPHIGSAFVSA